MIFLLFLTAVSYTAQAEGNEEGFTLQPGDILQVTVWKEEGMDREVLVLPDGTITFPLIGTLMVQDMTPFYVQSAIRDRLQMSIPDASVTVSVKAPLGHKVSVLGQVQKPGEVIMNTRMSVMEVLSQVGGLTPTPMKAISSSSAKRRKGKNLSNTPTAISHADGSWTKI